MAKKQSIQPQIKQFKLSELTPAKYNPRAISDEVHNRFLARNFARIARLAASTERGVL